MADCKALVLIDRLATRLARGACSTEINAWSRLLNRIDYGECFVVFVT
jgi:hypothetical protein